MKLSELLSVLHEYKSSKQGSTEVLGLTADTREVKPGYVFIAVHGTKQDGHAFIPQAIEKGAIAIVAENKTKVPEEILCVEVKSSRESLAKLARQFYQDPSRDLFCFGVTGTNGKTSTTYMLEHILSVNHISTGVLGTINHHLGKHIWSTSQTTPDPISLQKRLHEMKVAGASAIAMEVSSHALSQQRADSVHFNTVIFTNLTLDHLDYHQTMEEYFAAKQRLFSDLLLSSAKSPQLAVVNIDDEWGQKLRIADGCRRLTFGQKKSDFQFKVLQENFSGSLVEITTSQEKLLASLPIFGVFIYNAVGAIAAATSMGLSAKKSIEALATFAGVPGRMQAVPNKKSLHVFVDYAHSPDALQNVLRTLWQVKVKSSSQGQIWTIFGCGGDRDQSKRPIMGSIAAKNSDFVMITSDNPRTEDPHKIIQDIQKGIPAELKEKCFFAENRRKAFAEVFAKAKPHDVILIAGKGHENYQIVGDSKVNFSDMETAKELLR